MHIKINRNDMWFRFSYYKKQVPFYKATAHYLTWGWLDLLVVIGCNKREYEGSLFKSHWSNTLLKEISKKLRKPNKIVIPLNRDGLVNIPKTKSTEQKKNSKKK